MTFWEANALTAKAGQPAPFHQVAESSGLSHFFGLLVRFHSAESSPLFFDLKFGLNCRSIGDPAPSSDFSTGVGGAIGYALTLNESITLAPGLGYRILSYSVNQAAHYAHQGIDLNLLASFSL